jgi:hypothetical protein
MRHGDCVTLPKIPCSTIRRFSRSGDCRFECLGVVNPFASEETDLAGGDFGHTGGHSVTGCKSDLVTVAARIGVNDRSPITHRQPETITL